MTDGINEAAMHKLIGELDKLREINERQRLLIIELVDEVPETELSRVMARLDIGSLNQLTRRPEIAEKWRAVI